MNLAMKFESFGIAEIYSIIQSMFSEDENDKSNYNEGLIVFEADILPML